MTTPADDLPLPLDRTSPVPLGVQVADGLRAAAGSGLLRRGDRLPSSRALAARLGVSRTVVASAYDRLHAEGWLGGRRGSGTYLLAAPAATPAAPRPARTETEPGDLLDLAPGAPCAAAIDPAAWRRAWRAAADHRPATRRDRAGEPAYRDAVAEHLLRHRGLAAGPDAVVLATTGTGAAVFELAVAALPPNSTVAVEDPGYQRAVGGLRAAGLRVLPVPVDEHGLCVDAVPAGVSAVYCTPAHQFPLGSRMTAERRVRLVDLARERGFLVLEDDYDGELRYDTAPLPLLAALAPDVVVHLGTTSKILSPTLGAGWLVAAPHLAGAVLALRDRTGTSPAPAGQLVLAELARHGDLAGHLRRLRRVMPPRRATLLAHLTGLDVLGDDAGSHVVVPLPDAAAEDRAVAAARARGVLFDGLARHHLGARHRFGVALGYSAADDAELAAAARIAGECLRRS